METNILDTSIIVHRSKENDLFKGHLLQMKLGRKVDKPIIGFWGIPGIGKTTLLKEIIQKNEEHKNRVIFIDFKDFLTPRKRISRLILRESFLHLINSKLQSEYFDHKENLNKAEGSSLTIAELLSGILKYEQTVIFAFDSVEYCDAKFLEWLERDIFSPFISTKKILIILASQGCINWKAFDIKQSILEHKVNPFDTLMLQEQLRRNSSMTKEMANKIYEVSFGVPACNIIALKTLEKLAKHKDLNLSLIDTNKSVLVRAEVEFFYKQSVRRLNSEFRVILKSISLLSWFDYALLREILVAIYPEKYGNVKASKFRDITRQAEGTNFISWDIRKRGFAMDITLRKILSLDLRLNNFPLYLIIKNVVLKWFVKLTKEYEPSFLYFLDLIYYRALFDDLNPIQGEISSALIGIKELKRSHLEKITLFENIIRNTSDLNYAAVVPRQYIEMIHKLSEQAMEKLLNEKG